MAPLLNHWISILFPFSRQLHIHQLCVNYCTFDDDFVLANAEIDLDLGQIRGNGPNVSTFLADDESGQEKRERL